MKIELQVASIELSKRLKELNCKQESAFYWYEFDYGDNPNTWPGHIKPANEWRWSLGKGPGRYDGEVNLDRNNIAAFTCSELGMILPQNTMSEKICDGEYGCFMGLSEDGDDWYSERNAGERALQ